jgi:hypothetical protein
MAGIYRVAASRRHGPLNGARGPGVDQTKRTEVLVSRKGIDRRTADVL